MADSNTNEGYGIPDSLWKQIEPLLPPQTAKDGHPGMDDRKTVEAILYILHTNSDWEELPQHLGAPDAVLRRFHEWRDNGLFQRMWKAGLITYDELRMLFWHGRWHMKP